MRVLSPDCRVCSRRLEGRLRWQLSPLQLVELLSEHFEFNDEVGGGVSFSKGVILIASWSPD